MPGELLNTDVGDLTFDVRVDGPEDGALRCRVRMFERAAEATPTFELQFDDVAFPYTDEHWRAHLSLVRGRPDAQHAYDGARVFEIEFSADELGAFTLRGEREFPPLRWSLQRVADEYVLHLHDDVGGATPSVSRYAFERPTASVALPWQPGSKFSAPRSGGLYVAKLAEHVSAIIVPPIVRGFHELKFEPQIDIDHRTPDAVQQCLGVAELWSSARLPGGIISAQRRSVVLRALAARIASVIGGPTWSDAEASFTSGTTGIEDLKRAVSTRGNELAVGAKLFLERERLANAPSVARIEAITSLAERFRLVALPSSTGFDTKWLAEFALRIASNPTTVGAWASDRTNAAINSLMEAPTLARAARFLVLAVTHELRSRQDEGLYAGWEWGE